MVAGPFSRSPEVGWCSASGMRFPFIRQGWYQRGGDRGPARGRYRRRRLRGRRRFRRVILVVHEHIHHLTRNLQKSRPYSALDHSVGDGRELRCDGENPGRWSWPGPGHEPWWRSAVVIEHLLDRRVRAGTDTALTRELTTQGQGIGIRREASSITRQKYPGQPVPRRGLFISSWSSC